MLHSYRLDRCRRDAQDIQDEVDDVFSCGVWFCLLPINENGASKEGLNLVSGLLHLGVLLAQWGPPASSSAGARTRNGSIVLAA